MKKSTLVFIIFIVIFLIVGGFLIFRQLGISKLNQAFNRIQDIKSIKYDLSIYTNGQLLSKQTVWRKGTGSELKIKTAINGGFTMVSNYAKNLGYAISADNNKVKEFNLSPNPDEDTTDGTEKSFLDESQTIKHGNLIFVSNGKLDGKDCFILYFLGSDGLARHWIWKNYGISIKTKSKNMDIRRENMEVNSVVPDEIFDLPAGVEIIPPKN